MTARLTEPQLQAQLLEAFASLLGVPVEKVEAHPAESSSFGLFLKAAGQTFAVAVLKAASPGMLAARAPRAVNAARELADGSLPLLVVPFMGAVGSQICAGAGISWLDLSGNAHIVVPGLRVIVEGRPNRFLSPGRPASIFAPKSARVVRWLLIHAPAALSQREIARATGLSEGFVSKIVARLISESYVTREASGGIKIKNPQLLLDAWRAEDRFDRHQLIQGHVAARSGDALARFVGDTLAAASLKHAATGLTAAWQMTRFAAFRTATFFLAEPPTPDLREALGFREDARGANLWLVVPRDQGVFQGAELRDGLRCVHPVQAYVDLKAQPERAAEAADQLRNELLIWKST